MKDKIETWFKRLIAEAYAAIPYRLEKSITHALFSYVGIARLKRVIEEMEKAGIDYVSLAEIYGRVIRENLAHENSEVIHAYYELLPKLDEYRRSLSKAADTNSH